MSPESNLLHRLHVRFDWISDRGWMVIEALLRDPHVRPPADRIAFAAGLSSRYQLAYRIKREGLPPFRYLASWLALLLWLSAHETDGDSLCKLTLEEGLDPAYRYRMAKRLLGHTWTECSRRGLDWAVDGFAPGATSPERETSSSTSISALTSRWPGTW